MFLVSAVTRSTFTAGPSSISYRVTVGPALEPGDRRVHLELLQHLRSAPTTTSLARVRSFGALPGLSSAIGGRM